ncbi:MAG: caspase family protein [Phycisphaerae bacterium]|nr:caspase family protein [Phycisphaerae bacterium]
MKRFALLIGINGYRPLSGLMPLKYAEADAAALADLLSEQCGFETTTLLGQQATRDAIEESLFSAGQGDIFLFFFAGHGQMLSGQYKLHPVDSTASGLRSLSFPELTRHWQCELGYERVLAIIDACRSEMCGVRGSRGFEPAASRDISTSIQGNKWIEVLYGCLEGQVSYEVDDFGHGLMTRALMEIIGNPPGELDTNTLSGAAADWMRAWSRSDQQARFQEVSRYHRPSLTERIILRSSLDEIHPPRLVSLHSGVGSDTQPAIRPKTKPESQGVTTTGTDTKRDPRVPGQTPHPRPELGAKPPKGWNPGGVAKRTQKRLNGPDPFPGNKPSV